MGDADAQAPDSEVLQEQALSAIRAADTVEDLQRLEREYLGKDGPVGELMGSIKTAPPEKRKEIGQFREVIAKYCNKVSPPKITLVVVNKRIN